MSALEVDRVSRWFGDTVALSDVSFRSEPGVTGLLGHNGAGKSTLFDLLAGFTTPSQGTVRVLGLDPHADPAVHARLGLVPDGDGLWPFLTARQTVAFLARHRGVRDPDAAAARALDRVGLSQAADRKVAGFSKGMRQRVQLAQALAHDPEVLLLDEPLNGLDPAQRRADVDLLRSLGAEGRTVLVSSHVLGEVERMADRVLVVVNGRLVAEGTPAGVQELLARSARTVQVADAGRAPAGRPAARRARRRLGGALRGRPRRPHRRRRAARRPAAAAGVRGRGAPGAGRRPWARTSRASSPA